MGKIRATIFWAIATLMLAPASWWTFADHESPKHPPAQCIRRPVAAAFLADGRTLCVANQRSGSISLVDIRQAQLREEFVVGQHLTSLAVLPDGKHVLVVDDQRNELIVLAFDGTRLIVQAHLSVGPYPVSVAVLPDGTQASVASLWSRRVEVIDLRPLPAGAGPITLRVVHTVRLPFAPRLQCPLPRSSQVAVADAFGGHLAVVDAAEGRLVAVHKLNGHNLRGLALDRDAKHLLVSHQVLDQKATTTKENIAQGTLMANVVRWIPRDRLLTPGADLNQAGRMVRLGTVGAGAGDPAGIAVTDDGMVAVALAGVHEVALLQANGTTRRRLPVGRRPTAIVPGPPRQPLVIVNTFDDSLSLLDSRRGSVTGQISLGAQAKLDPQDRGELLFFDARLGRDGWLSCHSCHSDGHTNGLLADTLGDNTYGTPKRTLTLMGTALTDPWGWNGSMKYLHDQVHHSLDQTMHAAGITGEQVNDLVSFLHTLPPPPPPEPVTTDAADRAQVDRGRRIFHERGCVRCHIPPLTYTSHGTYDVGFADEKGLRNFNPPSLCGVGQGYGFFHDNRAQKLEQVFTKFRHKVGPDTPAKDIADLLRFLRSL
jgi:DNA-binding beta-propeller fold protein YncE/mono/diheme cytochrome c family protein